MKNVTLNLDGEVTGIYANAQAFTVEIAGDDARIDAFLNPPVPVPASVTLRQACIQLEIAGLLDDVEAIVATLPRIYQIEWQRASTVARDNPLVEMVRQQQAMTSEQIDALFIAADAL